jgi:hypothetical protein
LPANCHAAAPAKCRFPRLRAGIDTGAGTAFGTGWAESQYKGRHGAGDVLQFEWAERLKRDVELVADVIADRLRDADAGRRTLSLEPRCHIHDVAVDVSSIGDHIADVDADANADGPIRGLVAIIGGDLLLHLRGTAYRTVNAVEHDEEGGTSRINNLAAMLVDRRIDQSPTEGPESFERAYIIQSNQTAVTDYVGIDRGDQLPTAPCSSDPI